MLQLTDCSKQPRLVDCCIGVVNKLDRRRRWRALLTTRSTCRGEIFRVLSLGQISREKYPNFWRYQNFLITQCGTHGRKPPGQKLTWLVQWSRHNTGLWRTDERTHDDCNYRASISSRGKNRYECTCRCEGQRNGHTVGYVQGLHIDMSAPVSYTHLTLPTTPYV